MAKNPFNDDDETDEIRRANERDSEKVREGAESEEKSPKETDEDAVEIDLGKIEKEEADKAEAAEDARGSRAERRRDRYREQTEAARAAEERATQYERELQEERARRVTLETLQAQQRAPQQEADPEGEEILRVRSERKGTFAQYNAAKAAGTLTPQQEAEFEAKAYELNYREQQATILRVNRMNGGQKPGMTQQDVAREAHKQYLLATYPDVLGHSDPRVLKYVSATHDQLLAAGEKPGKETLEKAINQTRRQFRLGGQQQRSEPTEASRRRLSGGGAGPSGRGGGEPPVVRMNKDDMKMAEAAFGHLKPADAHKQWAKTAGRKLAEKRQSR